MISYRYFWPWSPYSRFQARRRGRRDGRLGTPPVSGDQFTPYEFMVKNLGDENISGIARRWEELDKRLKAAFCNARSKLSDAKEDCKQAQGSLAEIQGKYNEARRQMDEIRGLIRIHPVFYWCLVTFLVCGEFPLNAVVFKIFGEATAMTYVFSSVVALSLPLCGHFLGLNLRKKPSAEWTGSPEGVFRMVLILLPFLLILGIAYVREKYFEVPSAQLLAGVKMDPTMVTLVLIGVNLIAFVVATVASYMMHHPEDVQNRIDNFRVLTKELRVADRILKRAQAEQGRAEEALNNARTTREHAFHKCKAEADEVKNFVEGLTDYYRDSNLGGRSDPTLPPIWTRHPEVKFLPPLDSQDLDWDCPGSGDQEKTQEKADLTPQA